jgi:repressor LexA
MRTPLTKRQREILDYLNAHIRDRGYAPSLEEIGRTMGLSSLATVHKHLMNLQSGGYIVRRWNRSRSIEIIGSAHYCPTCGRSFEGVADANNSAKVAEIVQ